MIVVAHNMILFDVEKITKNKYDICFQTSNYKHFLDSNDFSYNNQIFNKISEVVGAGYDVIVLDDNLKV